MLSAASRPLSPQRVAGRSAFTSGTCPSTWTTRCSRSTLRAAAPSSVSTTSLTRQRASFTGVSQLSSAFASTRFAYPVPCAPRRTAFAEFGSEEAAQNAVLLNGQKLLGRPMKVELAQQKKPTAARGAPSRTLFVGRIPQDADENEIGAMAQKYGAVQAIRWSSKPDLAGYDPPFSLCSSACWLFSAGTALASCSSTLSLFLLTYFHLLCPLCLHCLVVLFPCLCFITLVNALSHADCTLRSWILRTSLRVRKPSKGSASR